MAESFFSDVSGLLCPFCQNHCHGDGGRADISAISKIKQS